MELRPCSGIPSAGLIRCSCQPVAHAGNLGVAAGRMGISQAACLLLLLCCAAPLRSVNGENPDLRTFLRTLDPAGGLTADLTANDGDICRVAGASCNGAGQLSELCAPLQSVTRIRLDHEDALGFKNAFLASTLVLGWACHRKLN